MRWPGEGRCDVDKYRMYYSGMPNGEYRSGVGIVVGPTIAQAVTNFVPVSDRLLLFQIDSKPLPINIIQVYAPTADQEEDEVRELYAQIEALKKQISKRERLIVM